jgi:hypothetical protein
MAIHWQDGNSQGMEIITNDNMLQNGLVVQHDIALR